MPSPVSSCGAASEMGVASGESERALGAGGASAPERAALAAIRWYQRYISPLFGRRCIYTPTCSEYAFQAIRKYGLGKGLWLATKRILRCHPFHEGGYDPVP